MEYKNISFTVWDVGGQDKIRPLWRHYFQVKFYSSLAVEKVQKKSMKYFRIPKDSSLLWTVMTGAKKIIFNLNLTWTSYCFIEESSRLPQ